MALAISEPAAKEIRERLASSRCHHPTASLLDSSQGFEAPSDMVDAISRKASDSEMNQLAVNEYRKRRSSLDFRLEVGIYEAADCPPDHFVSLDGIQFTMPKDLQKYFDGYVLDFSDGYFLLKKGDQTFVRLMDLQEGGRAV